MHYREIMPIKPIRKDYSTMPWYNKLQTAEKLISKYGGQECNVLMKNDL
jgi:hypothetical protein